jgi:hypothetical protein
MQFITVRAGKCGYDQTMTLTHIALNGEATAENINHTCLPAIPVPYVKL